MGGMGDRIQQSEQVSIALACGFCGEAAAPGHSCSQIETLTETQNEQETDPEG